jgi:hypothetical protein
VVKDKNKANKITTIQIAIYFCEVKAILRVLSNPAVLALLKMIFLLFELRSNNELPWDLTIPVMSSKRSLR